MKGFMQISKDGARHKGRRDCDYAWNGQSRVAFGAAFVPMRSMRMMGPGMMRRCHGKAGMFAERIFGVSGWEMIAAGSSRLAGIPEPHLLHLLTVIFPAAMRIFA
jgi:hypothetical protein